MLYPDYTVWRASDDAEFWNAYQAQKDIEYIKGLLPFVKYDEEENKLLDVICNNETEYKMMLDLCKEMSDIMNNKENASGFHLNHIVSGKTIYCVYDNNGLIYTPVGNYATEEEAQAEAAKLPGSRVEEGPDEDKPFRVCMIDDEETARMREEKWGGEFVDQFNSMDEAEEEAKQYENAYIQEEESEEWWSVVHNASGKLAFRMLFPTETRALAFLYSVAKPKAWMEYVDKGMEVKE